MSSAEADLLVRTKPCELPLKVYLELANSLDWFAINVTGEPFEAHMEQTGGRNASPLLLSMRPSWWWSACAWQCLGERKHLISLLILQGL